MTFDVYMPAIQEAYWYADISIYNLDQTTTEQLLTAQSQGMEVILQAGYQNGVKGTIWWGPIFQAFFERENVMDYKVTLHCLLRLYDTSRDVTSLGTTLAAKMTQSDVVKKIAQLAFTPVNNLSGKLKSTQLPRGKVLFGNLEQYLSRIAEDNNMQWWVGSRGLNFGSSSEDIVDNTKPPISFSPPAFTTHGAGPQPAADAGILIGTPQQTMYGVWFQALLDPRIQAEKPLMRVKIDNSQIRFLKLQINQLPPRPLDKDGVYVAQAVRHVGDTRGNEWYTEVDAFSVVGDVLEMLGLEAANANTNSARP